MFMEQGTGKSKIIIDIEEFQYKEGFIDGVILVVGPKNLVLNWANIELPKHANLKYDTIIWSDRIKKADTVFNQKHNNIVWLIINIDALITDRVVPYIRKFIETYPRFSLVIDESTCVKSMKAKRSIRAQKLAGFAASRFITSGTPVTNSPLDLYAQAEILKPGLLGKNFWAFRNRYAVHERIDLGFRAFDKIVGYQNLEELTSRVQAWGAILKKKDCLDLPEKMFRLVDCPMTTEQMEIYEDLRLKAITEIKDHKIHAVNAISLINKLLQVCAGQIKLDDGTYYDIPNNRIDTIEELVDEAKETKTIIWSAFRRCGYQIAERLKDKAVHIHADLTDRQRFDRLEDFKINPDFDALIANPASLGHGTTMIEAANTIYHSRTWNYEHRAQSQDRNHRIGQTKSVLYTDVVSQECKVEMSVIKDLTRKRDVSNVVVATPQEVLDMLEQLELQV